MRVGKDDGGIVLSASAPGYNHDRHWVCWNDT
jgi:hypothetical protein